MTEASTPMPTDQVGRLAASAVMPAPSSRARPMTTKGITRLVERMARPTVDFCTALSRAPKGVGAS